MRKKDKKGFTLIELLTTIAVLSLVLIIAGVGVTKVLDKVEENEIKVTMSTVKKSSMSYIEEFKTADKYWFNYGESEINDPDNLGKELGEKEYACTTVGQLINKGILNKKIIGKKTDTIGEDGSYKEINKNTSIIVNRDKNTKVILSENIDFNVDECLQEHTTNVSFSVSESTGDNDYYKIGDEAKVYMKITGQDGDEVNFSATQNTKSNNGKNDGDIFNKFSSNKLSNSEYDYEVTINNEAVGIEVCVTITSLKGNDVTHCLNKDGHFDFLNVDYSPPQITSDNFEFSTDNEYNLVARGATDNFTKTENIRYKINYNDNILEAMKSITYELDDSIRVQNGRVNLEIKDDAGNVSSITKVLDITAPISKTTETRFYCSEDGVYYSNLDEINEHCMTESIIDKKTWYYCLKNSRIAGYGRLSTIYDCEQRYGSGGGNTHYEEDEEDEIVEEDDSCPKYYTWSDDDNACIYEYKSSGWRSHEFKCDMNKGYYVPKDNTYLSTDYECDPCVGTGISCKLYQSGKYSSIELVSRNTCYGDLTNWEQASSSQKAKNFSCSSASHTYTYSDYCSNSCKIKYKINSKSLSFKFLNYSSDTEIIGRTDHYICNIDGKVYYSMADAEKNCLNTTRFPNGYYCSITNQTYKTNEEATSACTNSCDIGDYHNNACYRLSSYVDGEDL